jgi:hypothetical protein
LVAATGAAQSPSQSSDPTPLTGTSGGSEAPATAASTDAPLAAIQAGQDQSAYPVPVCQWGDCAEYCPEVCAEGFVCGVAGACVQVSTPTERVELQQTHEEAVQRTTARQLARYKTRIALGGSIGASSTETSTDRTFVAAQLGLRQQLSTSFGFQGHAQFALVPSDNTAYYQDTATRYEVAGIATPYFGPFGRFYIGPAVLAGYRWHSVDEPPSSPSMIPGYTPSRPRDRAFAEGGLKMGILAGSEEQFDITGLVTSDLSGNSGARWMAGFNYEFR